MLRIGIKFLPRTGSILRDEDNALRQQSVENIEQNRKLAAAIIAHIKDKGFRPVFDHFVKLLFKFRIHAISFL